MFSLVLLVLWLSALSCDQRTPGEKNNMLLVFWSNLIVYADPRQRCSSTCRGNSSDKHEKKSWFWTSIKSIACHLLQAVVLGKCRSGSPAHCSLCQTELPRHGSPVRLTLSSPRALKAASISQRWGTKARARAYDFQHPGPLPAPTLGPFGVEKTPTGCRKGQERTKERNSMGNPSSPR